MVLPAPQLFSFQNLSPAAGESDWWPFRSLGLLVPSLRAGLFISVLIERLPKETLPMVRCGRRNPREHLYHDVFILPSLPVVHSLVPTSTRHLLTDYQLCVSTRKVQDDVLFMCPD